MPFVRYSRDKRGYEHTYLIHATSKKGAPARILYWYRSPPGVKVGRPAFDAEVRRQLEAQYPHVDFDWRRISETPMPTADVEHWRERRRLEKAAKQARRAGGDDDEAEPAAPNADDPGPPPNGPDLPTAAPAILSEPVGRAPADVPSAPRASDSAPADPGAPSAESRKRRRRGGRRRRRGPASGDPGQAGESDGSDRAGEDSGSDGASGES